jgi:hypothetical protein
MRCPNITITGYRSELHTLIMIIQGGCKIDIDGPWVETGGENPEDRFSVKFIAGNR